MSSELWSPTTDKALSAMKKHFKDMHKFFAGLRGIETRTCTFLGSQCEQISTITVAALPGIPRVRTHQDLDVFMWLPKCPNGLDHFADLSNAFRKTFTHRPVGSDVHFRYTFIHYDQCIAGDMLKCHNNVVLSLLLKLDTCDWNLWSGDILVVKSSEEGMVLDIDSDDILVIPDMLPELVGKKERAQHFLVDE